MKGFPHFVLIYFHSYPILCYTPPLNLLQRGLLMSSQRPSRLRFNFGFFLEASLGTTREIELDYPTIVAEDVTLTPLQGTFSATRTSEGVYVSGKLHSFIELDCVRCLTATNVPIEFELDELFYYPPSTAPKGELVIGDDGYIDLAPSVRELSILAAPIQPLCKPDCAGLCMDCGTNLNETDCDCVNDDIDPRFAVLKTLLQSDN